MPRIPSHASPKLESTFCLASVLRIIFASPLLRSYQPPPQPRVYLVILASGARVCIVHFLSYINLISSHLISSHLSSCRLFPQTRHSTAQLSGQRGNNLQGPKQVPTANSTILAVFGSDYYVTLPTLNTILARASRSSLHLSQRRRWAVPIKIAANCSSTCVLRADGT